MELQTICIRYKGKPYYQKLYKETTILQLKDIYVCVMSYTINIQANYQIDCSEYIFQYKGRVLKKDEPILSQVPPGEAVDVIEAWSQSVMWNDNHQRIQCISGNSYQQLLLDCLQKNGIPGVIQGYGLFYENGEQVNLNNQLQISEKDKTIYCCKEWIHIKLMLREI